MEQSVTLDLGATTASVVDVVTLQGDQISITIEVDTPVCVSITGGRVVGNTVDVVVGDTHAVVSGGAQHVMLTTDTSGLDGEG